MYLMENVPNKWGFGNAPLKKSHRDKTESAIHTVLNILNGKIQIPNDAELDDISHVKGQFTRTVKQNQWDWFTVWSLLGCPSRKPATVIFQNLGLLRSSYVKNEPENTDRALIRLNSTRIEHYLNSFLYGKNTEFTEKSGFIYILSTRSQPKVLKIGMTRRPVEIRVKEINSATGVVIPYGIRATWQVDDCAKVEHDIHKLLSNYRVRSDREFFELDFYEASSIVNNYLASRRRNKSNC